jgi:hypothetical protein
VCRKADFSGINTKNIICLISWPKGEHMAYLLFWFSIRVGFVGTVLSM